MQSQAQILTKKNTQRFGQAVKEGFKDIKEAIIQDAKPTGEHEQWDSYAGAKLGLNLSNLPGIDGNVKLGLIGGGFFEVFLTKNLSVGIEAEYSRQGSSGIYRALSSPATSDGQTPLTGPYDVKLDYINTNYIVRWYPWIDLPWSFMSGVRAGYLIGSRAKLKNGENLKLKDDIRNGDVALMLGVSYEWKQWQIEGRYNLYFRKLANSESIKYLMQNARNNMFEVTLGYRIQVF